MAPVVLHVYDLGTSPNVLHINRVSYALGGGLYHTAVEVYGQEYSFGYAEAGSGVYGCAPTKCELHTYKQSVTLGVTNLTHQEVKQVLGALATEYPANSYELLTRNCHTFCNELAQRLQVDGMPTWITRFPTIGHTTLSAVQTTKAKVRALNEQLHLSAKAAVIGDKAAVVQQSLSTGISSAWARASAAATQAAERTKEFEAKHKLRDRTLLATFRGMNFVNTSFNKMCGNPDFTESPTGVAEQPRGFKAAAEGEDEDNPLMQEAVQPLAPPAAATAPPPPPTTDRQESEA